MRLCKFTSPFIQLTHLVYNRRQWSVGTERQLRELEQYFRALADSTRLRILNLLLHGELCVCDIQHVLDASQPTVSRHLAYLRNAGLVRDRRDGYRIFYRLAGFEESAKRRLYRFLREICVTEKAFEADNRQLRAVIKAGACTLSEWKPYSAIAGSLGSTDTPRTRSLRA